MAIVKDPEGHELAALLGMVDFKGRDVLEAGCGDGRFTWRYAAQAAQVTAIDPNGEAIEAAEANLPAELKRRVTFFKSSWLILLRNPVIEGSISSSFPIHFDELKWKAWFMP